MKLGFMLGFFLFFFSFLSYLLFLAVKLEVTSGVVIANSLRYFIFSVLCMFKALLHRISLIPENESMLRTINLGLYKVFRNQNNFRKIFIRLMLQAIKIV